MFAVFFADRCGICFANQREVFINESIYESTRELIREDTRDQFFRMIRELLLEKTLPSRSIHISERGKMDDLWAIAPEALPGDLR